MSREEPLRCLFVALLVYVPVPFDFLEEFLAN